MSYHFTADGQGLRITSSGLNYNAAYTIMWSMYLDVDRNDFTTIFMLDPGDLSDYDHMALASDGTRFELGTPISNTDGTDLSLTTWYKMGAARESATSFKAYLNDALDITYTADVGTSRPASTQLDASNIPVVSRHLGGYLTAVKAWTRALTLTQIQAESGFADAVDATNIYGVWPLTVDSGPNDISGNGHHFSVIGSPSLVEFENPGIVYPSSGISIPVVMHHFQQQGFN